MYSRDNIYPKAPQQRASSLEFLFDEMRSRYTRRMKNTVAEMVNKRKRSQSVIVCKIGLEQLKSCRL